MKKLFAGLMLCLLATVGARQASAQANIGGLLYASAFGTWTVPQGTNGPYAWSSPTFCQINTNAVAFAAFTVGTPIEIVDANPALNEVVTPTAVFSNGFGCSITISPVYQHNSFHLASSTAGLQEALNYAIAKNFPAVIVLTPEWSGIGGTTGIIGSVTGTAAISISDQRISFPNPYAWNGSQYVLVPIGQAPGCATGTCVVTNPSAPQTITENVNGPNSLTISNPNAGAAVGSSLVLTNGTDNLLMGINGTGNANPGSSAFISTHPGGEVDFLATNGNIKFGPAFSGGTYIGSLILKPDLTANFSGLGIFNIGANFNGPGSYVNENFWTFQGSTVETHGPATFDDFQPTGTATSSNNYSSMDGPGQAVSYWTGAAADRGEAYPYVSCAAGSNPLCTYSLSWNPNVTFPSPGGTATLAESFPGLLTVPTFKVTTFTSVGNCWTVGTGGSFVDIPCSTGSTNATELQGYAISATAPTTGQSPTWNGTAYVPAGGTAGVQLASATTQTVGQSGGTLAVNNLNNYYLASQYQTGGGNNGIANVAALNGGTGITGIADPGYAATEVIPGLTSAPYTPNVYTPIPNYPQFTHIKDNRAGHQMNLYTESGAAAYTPTFADARYYFNTYSVVGATASFQAYSDQCNFEGTGRQINGFGGVNLKSYFFCKIANAISTAQGQKFLKNDNLFCNGVGDCTNETRNTEGGGGTNAYTDQGIEDLNATVSEAHSMTMGTIATVGSGTFKATISAGYGKQGQGRYVGDTAQVVTCAGYPTCYTLGDFNFPPSPTIWGQDGPVPPMATFVGTTFTPSRLMMGCTTAFGGSCPNTSGANPSGQLQSAAGGYAPGTLTVQIVTVAPGLPTAYQTTTTGFATNDIVTVADGQYVEQALVTGVPDSTHITIAFAKPHFNGFTISKGGYSGYGIEVTGATTTVGGVPYQQVWPVVGTLDATHLLVWDHNSQQTWSRSLLVNNNAACQTVTVTNFSNVAAVISMYDATRNTLIQNAPNVTIATANATYNGTFALTSISGFYGGLANQPALSYTAGGTPSGAVPTTGTATFCNTAVNLYPIAETLDVLNPATDAVDGYFKIAPISWTPVVGDTITQFHWPAQVVAEGGNAVFQELPMLTYNGFTAGQHEIVGDNFTGWNAHQEQNITATTKYQGYGGALPTSGAVAYSAAGMWGNILDTVNAPDNAVIRVENCKFAPIGCNNAALSPFMVYDGPGAQQQIWNNGPGGSMDFSGPMRINHGAFSMSMYSPSFGIVAFSQDQSSSLTPDAQLEVSSYVLWNASSGTNASISTTSTANELDLNGASGAKTANVYATNLTLSGTCTGCGGGGGGATFPATNGIVYNTSTTASTTATSSQIQTALGAVYLPLTGGTVSGATTFSAGVTVNGGTPGVSTPNVVFTGATSGSVTVLPQAVAGTPTITWPTTSGQIALTTAEVVTYSATPTFTPGDTMSRMVLTGSVTSFTMGVTASGTPHTLCFKQGGGVYTVTPPANVHGFSPIGNTSGKWNCQQFMYDASDSIWLATSAGVINQ